MKVSVKILRKRITLQLTQKSHHEFAYPARPNSLPALFSMNAVTPGVEQNTR
jgi:hypothetical protein